MSDEISDRETVNNMGTIPIDGDSEREKTKTLGKRNSFQFAT